MLADRLLWIMIPVGILCVVLLVLDAIWYSLGEKRCY